MATISGNTKTDFSFYAFETMNVVSNFGQNWRYVFIPANAESPPPVASSRSFGPAAQNVTIGPFNQPGTFQLWNDSTSALTYFRYDSIVQAGTLTTTGPSTLNGGPLTITPANTSVTISPTGTGVVTIAPGSTGTMNNMTIGSATRQTGAFTILTVSKGDSSGTPGNVTQNAAAGRVAIAAGANNVVVTNNVVGTLSTVFAVISQAAADATLTQIVRVVPAAGSFTIYGNANATANTVVDYLVFGN